MSYGSKGHSESSQSRRSMDGDTTEDGGDDRDESKRRSRNLSEKKRRDQFNVLINELCTMVSTSARKMDKSTVLKATIAFLKAHNELAVQSQVQETQEDWKPSFLSNEEFTHLMLEALDGFIIVISSVGKILYLSESITSLLGYLSTDLVNGSSTIYDYVLPDERNDFYGMLTNPAEEKYKGQVSIVVNFRVGGLEVGEEEQKYQLVKLVGYFKRWISPTDCGAKSTTGTDKGSEDDSQSSNTSSSGCILIATGRLMVCDLLREMSVVVDSEKNEFASRHSLEWKFLFLDHRAPPIIGYLPFEVLGTSGYDYYHVEDLEKVATCHEALMQRGEGTSCYYRFLTKGQQWIWLQTRFYITYHQWNSKPEFIVCTHRVVSYADVMKELRGEVPTSAFEETPSNQRLGPTVPKHPKLESSKGSSSSHSSLRSSSRHKNGSLSYGSVGSKRSSHLRKLELPPKFASALTSSAHSSLPHPLPQSSRATTSTSTSSMHLLSLPVSSTENLTSSSNGMSMVCSKPLSTAVSVAGHHHPPPATTTPQGIIIAPQHLPAIGSPPINPPAHNRSFAPPASVSLPVASYNSLPPTSSTFAVASGGALHASGAAPTLGLPMSQGPSPLSSSPCVVVQEELMKKHAELQRQIVEQQEELRRVSEQLLMAQCGWIQGDPLLLPPPPHNQQQQQQQQQLHPQQQEDNSSAQLQPVQCQSQSLLAYSPHPAPPPPPGGVSPLPPPTSSDNGCFGLTFNSGVT